MRGDLWPWAGRPPELLCPAPLPQNEHDGIVVHSDRSQSQIPTSAPKLLTIWFNCSYIFQFNKIPVLTTREETKKERKKNVGIQSLNNSSFHLQSITASLLPTPKNSCLVPVWGCSLFSPKSPLYPDTLIDRATRGQDRAGCSPLGGTDPRTICLPSHFIRKSALNEGKRSQRWKSATWWQIDGTGI